jgi:hypothetical protein
MAGPMTLGSERQLADYARELRDQLGLLDLAGAADGALGIALREALEAVYATISEAQDRRRAEEAAQRRQEDRRRQTQARHAREQEVAREAATTFLEARLSNGPVRRSELFEAAEAAGINRGALDEAARELGAQELPAAFQVGTLAPDQTPFLTLTARPGITQPAA